MLVRVRRTGQIMSFWQRLEHRYARTDITMQNLLMRAQTLRFHLFFLNCLLVCLSSKFISTVLSIFILLLAFLMRNYLTKRPSGASLHT